MVPITPPLAIVPIAPPNAPLPTPFAPAIALPNAPLPSLRPAAGPRNRVLHAVFDIQLN